MLQFGNKIWEELHSARTWGKYPPEEVIRSFFFAKKKLNMADLKALDIGCGIGACSWFLRKECDEVTAFDGSPSGLKNVPDLAKEFNVNENITLLLGDIIKPLEYINSEFDIILDNYSLYANPEEEIINALEGYYEISSDAGCFLLNCFGERTTGFRTGKQLSDHTWTDITEGNLQDRGVVTWFTRDRLNNIFNNIGFSVSYYENILENRNGVLIEKHITCLTK